MKIVLVTIGSRGDVQPMIALCLALQTAGHETVLVGPPERAAWATTLGCRYMGLGRNITVAIDSQSATHSLRAATAFTRLVLQSVEEQFRCLPAIIRGADLVVGASLAFSLSSLTEAMGIPYRYIAFTPQLIPSGLHPCPMFKLQRLPHWCNRLGWRLMLAANQVSFARSINRQRRGLGLPAVNQEWLHVLGPRLIVATDAALSPLPADSSIDARQTGYMHLRQPPCRQPELEHFLEIGPPPLYAGFGSMPRPDQIALMSLLKAAARQTGRRLVLARFWEERSSIGETQDLFYISRYPHEQLFPRMAAIIHHGGAGTTATAAISGKPQIIVPFILDQYYWGEQVFRSGLGPQPIARTRLTRSKLAKAIHAAISSPIMARKAEAVRKQILQQDGTLSAVREIIDGTRQLWKTR